MGWTLLCTAVVGAIYGLYLDSVIRTRFEGRRWALPGRVYARALEVHPGASITPAEPVTSSPGRGGRPGRVGP